MFKLCHYLKDDNKMCNAAAMRRQIYCYHHLELLRRERRIARTRQRLLQAIFQDNPLNSLPAVQKAIERIVDGMPLDKLDKKRSKVLLPVLSLMADSIRYSPELAESPNLRQEVDIAPGGSVEGGVQILAAEYYACKPILNQWFT